MPLLQSNQYGNTASLHYYVKTPHLLPVVSNVQRKLISTAKLSLIDNSILNNFHQIDEWRKAGSFITNNKQCIDVQMVLKSCTNQRVKSNNMLSTIDDGEKKYISSTNNGRVAIDNNRQKFMDENGNFIIENNGVKAEHLYLSDIDSTLPEINLKEIEKHLRSSAKRQEQLRHADREEIRRRLAAMGADDTDSANTDDLSSYTKWSQTQRHWKFGAGAGRSGSGSSAGTGGGMHMQICFMNNTICDSDDVAPNSTTSPSSSYCGSDLEIAAVAPCLPQKCCEFETRQARLQIEARMALAQAKQMARAEMCAERQKRQRDASTHSPIAQMVRDSLARVGVSATTTGQQQIRRFSRQLLTDMNVAQLQVIVNDLHGRIETLNEALVGMLMKRDDLHMEQDSMLVDIEDLTRYFDAKEQSRKSTGSSQTSLTNPFKFIGNSPKTTGRNVKTDNSASTSIKPHFHRFGSLIAN